MVALPRAATADAGNTAYSPRTWIVALALVLLVLVPWELYWRSRGWTQTVEGNRESWILARGRVRAASTVIAGTSRIQAALDPEVWSAATGAEPPIHLAIAAGSPLPLLEDLAADPGFHGLLIMELLPFYAFEASLGSEIETREFVDAFHASQSSPSMRWEAYLRTHVSSYFVFRRTKLLPDRLLTTLGNDNLEPPEQWQRQDRFHPIAFTDAVRRRQAIRLADTSRFMPLIHGARPATGAALDQIHYRIRTAIGRIIARQGRVVIVHLNACGARRFAEDTVMPKGEYWPRLSSIPGVLAIDSDDVHEIATLPCRDGSHVDVNDAPSVTRALAARIVGKGS